MLVAFKLFCVTRRVEWATIFSLSLSSHKRMKLIIWNNSHWLLPSCRLITQSDMCCSRQTLNIHSHELYGSATREKLTMKFIFFSMLFSRSLLCVRAETVELSIIWEWYAMHDERCRCRMRNLWRCAMCSACKFQFMLFRLSHVFFV